jgi:heme/copper-type cytochrome/quinol oxidase subunit 2
MNGISIAIIVYVISYYIMKFKWAAKVEKPQKIFTTGVGIYFIAWLVFWVLFYTLTAA